MKKVKSGIYWVLSVAETVFVAVVVVLAIINVTMFTQRIILKKAVPKIMGYSWVSVLSGSMEPTLSVGDLAICKEQAEYSVGDAVLYEAGERLVLHRVVEAKEDGTIITQGDANNVVDKEPVPVEEIHGKMLTSINGLGNTIMLMSKPLGAALTVLTCLFVYLALDMSRDMLRDTAQRHKESDAQKEIGEGAKDDQKD